MKKKLVWGSVTLVLAVLALVHWVLPGYVERSMNVVSSAELPEIRPEIAMLHQRLFIADLHADSLLWKRDLLKRSRTGHVDLPRLQEGNVAVQVFSAVTKSPSGLNYASNTAESDDITLLAVLSMWPLHTWDSLFERTVYQLQKLDRFAQRSDEQLVVVRSKAEFAEYLKRRLSGEKVVAGLFMIEGAHPLEGDIENLDRLFDQGLRFAGLTHFFDNELGGSLHGVSGAGLSEFGRKVIKRSNQLGIIIDVAHASPAMVRDVLAVTTRPVILSHGGLRGACDSQRNLSDELMRELADNGALLGVGYWPGAVCEATPAAIVRTIRYAIDLMGIQNVALGSDFDGTVETPFDTSNLAQLTQEMVDTGFTEREIRLVMGENVRRFLMLNLPNR
ncbi:MAG: dipeptidase [Gammaproteobacteria bacterium]|nr:dipeptidase [Gammaproteobacteria bacterium]